MTLVLDLAFPTTRRQRRALVTFARSGVARLDRELGELRWLLRATSDGGASFACEIAVHIACWVVEARGHGRDAMRAIHAALVRTARVLRELPAPPTDERDHLWAG